MNAIIPQINIQVSVDCFYDLLKTWGGSVSDSFHLKQSEVGDAEKYLLNWLTDNSKLLGSVTVEFQCRKFGNTETKQIHVDEIKSKDKGWLLIEHY